VHERVDVARWKATFPLDALRACARERVLAISGRRGPTGVGARSRITPT